MTSRRYRDAGTLVDNLTYTTPAGSNRLSGVSDAAGTTTETWDAETGSLTYDANGNVLTVGAPYSVTAATYDARNLPLSLTKGGVATTYRYDETGLRIAKRVGSGNTEVYLRDGGVELAVFVVNGSGVVQSSYFNVMADEKVVGRQVGGGSRLYYHRDLLGSTRAVVQGTTVVESRDYDPWGVLMAGRTLGTDTTKEGFSGKERDAETGLDYFGFRYYMAALGRWTTTDPLTDQFPQWNGYNYVENQPTRLVDPWGLAPLAAGEADARQGCPPCEPVQLGFPTFIGGPRGAAGTLGRAAVAVLRTKSLSAGRVVMLGGELAETSQGLVPVARGAATKIQERLVSKFGGTVSSVIDDALQHGTRVIDQARNNSGNINIFRPRPDGLPGLVRVTLDPTQTRVISAGLNRANDLARGLASGRYLRP